MRCSVILHTWLPGADPAAVFARLADFASYPDFTATVRTVAVKSVGPNQVESSWEVNFRKGILVWSERDDIDPLARRIGFTQITGDFATFTGEWLVHEEESAVRVEFISAFDLGIASLAALIDPVACNAMRDAIRDILFGLFGESAEIKVIEAAPVG